jgi:CheY-like chemotaxis protein
MAADGIAEIIQAATGLLWPLLVAGVILLLLPTIKRILTSRNVTIKAGGVEIDVQQAFDKLVKSTAELQAKESVTPARALGPTPPVAADQRENSTAAPRPVIRTILWVDDKPKNNAYEIAQLESLGVVVHTAPSTAGAMSVLSERGSSIDVVISDMGRQEGSGPYATRAGLELIRQMRAGQLSTPVVIYAGKDALELQDEVVGVGGNGVATRETGLFELLARLGDFPR